MYTESHALYKLGRRDISMKLSNAPPHRNPPRRTSLRPGHINTTGRRTIRYNN